MDRSPVGAGNTTMFRFSKIHLTWAGALILCSGLVVFAQQLRAGVLRVGASVENFRDAPNGRKLGTLDEGVEVEKIAQDGKWVRFRVEGWVWGPSLEGFEEEQPRQERASEPAPRLPLQDAMPRVKRLINEDYGTFYGLHIDTDLEILRVRLRVSDIGPERLRVRQRTIMQRVWALVGEELEVPIRSVRVESNRADGSGAVGAVLAECAVEVLEGEVLDAAVWEGATRFSSDAGQTWEGGS